MKRAVVVGSGAGGSTVARELQGCFQVTVLEAGGSFHPFTRSLSMIERLKKPAAPFLSERQIQWIFPSMKIDKTGDGMVLVRGIGEGGTTTISAGNAVRQDQDLKAIGIDLDAEFLQLSKEIPIYTDHQDRWHAPTREAYRICRDMGLRPQPTPKMIRRERCVGCGRCVLGCPHGAKWDSRDYLNQAIVKGAQLVSGKKVQQVVIENGRATGVVATNGRSTQLYPADLVILAAGGFGTPVILQQSGIACQSSLFVDPVLCVATRWEDATQNREMPMPFTVQRERFMISPYFDFVSFFFNSKWKYPAGDIFSLMIKLADTNEGGVDRRGVRKRLLDRDRAKLSEAVDLCRQVFRRLGKSDADMFLGTLNAGHPGGMLPLTEREFRTLHHECLPPNLYVADATLFPNALGNPPILTILALAKRIAKTCREYAG
jgi:choline dehydrogenase-like flavoprotein